MVNPLPLPPYSLFVPTHVGTTMPLGGPKVPCIRWVQIPTREGANLKAKRSPPRTCPGISAGRYSRNTDSAQSRNGTVRMPVNSNYGLRAVGVFVSRQHYQWRNFANAVCLSVKQAKPRPDHRGINVCSPHNISCLCDWHTPKLTILDQQKCLSYKTASLRHTENPKHIGI